MMYAFFGKRVAGECGDCKNLKKICVGGNSVYKCRLYGVTNSEASDWAKSWQSCGMFDKDVSASFIPVIERRVKVQALVEGQVRLEAYK